MTNPTALVSKLWNCCSPATAGRDDGRSYGDCVEQLTLLLLAPFRSGFAHRLALPVCAGLPLRKALNKIEDLATFRHQFFKSADLRCVCRPASSSAKN